jgi:hypothetical protein
MKAAWKVMLALCVPENEVDDFGTIALLLDFATQVSRMKTSDPVPRGKHPDTDSAGSALPLCRFGNHPQHSQ